MRAIGTRPRLRPAAAHTRQQGGDIGKGRVDEGLCDLPIAVGRVTRTRCGLQVGGRDTRGGFLPRTTRSASPTADADPHRSELATR